jgi:single-strand DNA-binding protein
VSKYFVKGQLVCVEGRLQRRAWTDKDDNTRYAFEIIAENVHFAGLNKNDTGGQFDPFADEAA